MQSILCVFIILAVFVTSCSKKTNQFQNHYKKPEVIDLPGDATLNIDYIPGYFDKECIVNLKTDLENFKPWRYDSVNNYFKVSPYFIKEIERGTYSCLTSRSPNEIISFFGKPTKEIINKDSTETYKYLITICNNTTDSCGYFVFYFNSKHVVRKYEKLTEVKEINEK